MAYTTERMDEILKSPSAQKIIQRLTNKYGDAYTVLYLIQAIGAELDILTEASRCMKDQVLPQTATWSLPVWEEAFGIIPNPNLPDKDRREAIVRKRAQRKPMNPLNMADAIKDVTGEYNVRIEENTGLNVFKVWISSVPTEIGTELLEEIKKAVDTVKQVHTIYNIDYERTALGKLHFGTVVQRIKKVNLKG